MMQQDIDNLIGTILNDIDKGAATPEAKQALGRLAGMVFGGIVRIAEALETLTGKKP